MTNREKLIEAMKLLKEGCKNIRTCNSIDCPFYEYCDSPPCNWIIIEEDK